MGEEPLPVGNDLEMGIGGGGGAPTASSGDWKIPPPTGNPLKGRFEEAGVPLKDGVTAAAVTGAEGWATLLPLLRAAEEATVAAGAAEGVVTKAVAAAC